MALVSALTKFIDNLRGPLKFESLPNEAAKAGVKPAEIEHSGIMNVPKETLDERGRVSPENLQLQNEARTDTFRDMTFQTDRSQGYTAPFANVSLPDTNADSYRVRIYSDPRGKGSSIHFPIVGDNYSFHVRGDVITAGELEDKKTLGTNFFERVEPTFGDRAIRIQEIQSDIHNQAISGKSTTVPVTTLYRQLEERGGTLETLLEQDYQVDPADIPRLLAEYHESLVYVHPRLGEFSVLQTGESFFDSNVPIIVDADIFMERYPDLPAAEAVRTFYRELGVTQEEELQRLTERYLAGDYELELSSEIADKLLAQEQIRINPQFKDATEEDVLEVIQNVMSRMYTDLQLKTPEKIEFNVPYIRQALFHELDSAQEQGIREVQIAINPRGIENLHRAPGVQKNYETTVRNTAKKIAKQIGAEVKEEKGYLIIGLPAAGFSLPLYAQTADEPALEKDQNKSFIESAMAQGISEEDAKKALFVERAVRELGMTREQAIAALEEQQATKPTPAAAAVATEGQVEQELSSSEMPVRGEGESYDEYATRLNAWHAQQGGQFSADPRENAQQQQQAIDQFRGGRARDLVSAYREGLQVAKPYTELSSLWSASARAQLEAMEQEMAEKILPSLKERGINLHYENGQYFVVDEQGNMHDATPTMLQDIYGDKFEIGGAIAGGAAGATTGARFGWMGALAGGVAGAVIGSVAGTELDYLNSWIETQETLSAGTAAEKAWGAAKASLFYDALGLAGVGTVKGVGKTAHLVNNIIHRFTSGNIDGATQLLLTALNKTPEEAQEVIRRWEKINNMKAPGKNSQENFLAILPTTEAGGHAIIAKAASENPRASFAIANEIDARAQALLKEAESIGSPQSAERVLQGMRSYLNDTATFLRTVQDQFNEVEVARVPPLNIVEPIEKAFDSLLHHNTDVRAHEFLIEKMQSAMDLSRSVASGDDILELRKFLTGLKHSDLVKNTRAHNAIDGVTRLVDNYILNLAKANEDILEKPGEVWVGEYREANKAYSKMMQVQRNGLFKATTKDSTSGKPVTAKSVANAFVRYGPSIDENFILMGGKPLNTYDQVMNELSVSTVKEVESLIVQQLTDKFTAGTVGSFRATAFPQLAEQLSLYKFRSPEAQRIKTVVQEMATLYKNDVHLSRAAGGLSVPQFESFLTADPVVRAKFALATEVFKYTSAAIGGGPKADVRALVNNVARLLEKPLNTQTTSQVLELVRQDQDLAQAIKEYQATMAQARADGTAQAQVQVRQYKDSSGALYAKPGKGRKLLEETIPGKAVAREDYVREAYGVEGEVSASTLTKLTKADLLNDGYESIILADGRIIKLF